MFSVSVAHIFGCLKTILDDFIFSLLFCFSGINSVLIQLLKFVLNLVAHDLGNIIIQRYFFFWSLLDSCLLLLRCHLLYLVLFSFLLVFVVWLSLNLLLCLWIQCRGLRNNFTNSFLKLFIHDLCSWLNNCLVVVETWNIWIRSMEMIMIVMIVVMMNSVIFILFLQGRVVNKMVI